MGDRYGRASRRESLHEDVGKDRPTIRFEAVVDLNGARSVEHAQSNGYNVPTAHTVTVSTAPVPVPSFARSTTTNLLTGITTSNAEQDPDLPAPPRRYLIFNDFSHNKAREITTHLSRPEGGDNT